jgi:hypothetical protein
MEPLQCVLMQNFVLTLPEDYFGRQRFKCTPILRLAHSRFCLQGYRPQDGLIKCEMCPGSEAALNVGYLFSKVSLLFQSNNVRNVFRSPRY